MSGDNSQRLMVSSEVSYAGRRHGGNVSTGMHYLTAAQPHDCIPEQIAHELGILLVSRLYTRTGWFKLIPAKVYMVLVELGPENVHTSSRSPHENLTHRFLFVSFS